MIIKILNRQKNIIVNLFLILVLTVFFSIHGFARTFEELSKAVAALPETTKPEKIKKSLLNWALADYGEAKAAGLEEKAAATLKDVEDLLGKNIGGVSKTPSGLFPPVPNADKNPIAIDAVKNITKIFQAKTTYGKGPANLPTSAGPLNTASNEVLALIQGFVHPQSPFNGDPSLVEPIMRRLEFLYEFLTPDSKLLADPGFSSAIAEAYLLIKTAHPDLILPSRKVLWEKALTDNADTLLAKYGQIFKEAKPTTSNINVHSKIVTSLVYSAFIFNRKDLLDASDAGLKLIEDSMYPDGGFPFVGEQNDAFAFHGTALTEMARLWQLTQLAQVKRIIEKSKNYYPLSIEPPGVTEYSTAPSWRRYWSQNFGAEEAAIIAAMTGDAQNLRIAKMNNYKGSFTNAFFYRDSPQPITAPDNYFVYDRNIQGVRGRFGLFSMSGTGRELKEDKRGKATLVGAMILNTPDIVNPQGTYKNWTLNAALQDASTEVRVKEGDRNVASTHLSLISADKNAVTVSKDFAALSSKYQLSAYNQKPASWDGTQTWIYTPNRFIGLVTLESTKAQNALGAMGVLTFVSGRGNWGTRKEFEKKADNLFKYGGFLARLHEQNFGTILTEYKDVLDGINNPDNKAGRLVMMDAKSSKSSDQIQYSPGTKFFYLAEIQPEKASGATQVKRLSLENGLLGFEFQEDKTSYRIIFNPTTAGLEYQAKLDWSGEIYLHLSGEQYRPAWIAADSKEEIAGEKPVKISNGEVKITIGAGTHVVLVSAN